jgi:hypothetical protein
MHANNLHRRKYVLRFALKRSGSGVLVNLDCEFELVNGSKERMPYVQEVTIDDCENGFMERLAVLRNEIPIYLLKRPAPPEKHLGYSSYKGPRVLIEPAETGETYVCKAIWTIHRRENDFWYNHMVLPTFGARMDIQATPNFEITPSFSVDGLVMPGEHLDVTWKPR